MGKKIRITRRTSFRHFELIFNRIHAIHAFCASAEGQRHNSLSDLPRDARSTIQRERETYWEYPPRSR
jgi:hypothetical protein